jgi:hypothetical protein
VTIQEYISSGIIESYVMGMASDQERAEFERLCVQHPELLEARIHFEKALEKKAFANAIEPPPFLKQKIWSAISTDNASSTTPVVAMMADKQIPSAPVRRMRTLSWVAAASVIVLLVSAYLVYSNYERNQRLKQEIARSKQTIEVMDSRARKIEDLLSRTEPKQVKVQTPQQNIPPTFNVYWDSTNADAYLVIDNLATLPQHQQYEIWFIEKGEHTNIGRFDSPEDGKIILRLPEGKDVDSFAITIAKKEANVNP